MLLNKAKRRDVGQYVRHLFSYVFKDLNSFHKPLKMIYLTYGDKWLKALEKEAINYCFRIDKSKQGFNMGLINEVKNAVASKEADAVFFNIYADSDLIEFQKKRYLSAIDRFYELYKEEEIEIFSAPGRSEIMGNHTDHQHGEVLCCSINLDAIAIVHKENNGIIRVVSGDYPEMTVDINDIELKGDERPNSSSLIKGICAGLKTRGYAIGGFKAYVTSEVIVGAGLSSSAAFETLIGTILSHLYNDGKVNDTEIAMIGQYAENVYFKKPCGLMDQMACSVGNLVHIDFRDDKNPPVEKIDFDLSNAGYSLCITDTKGSHADLTDEYAAVPKEMKEVAKFFGKEYLIGLTENDILNNIKELREKVSDRAILRAIHFIRENERVKEGTDALKKSDVEHFLYLISKSGQSSFEYLQNVYTCKDNAHQNVSLALAVSDGVLDKNSEAFRVHGGGFAGTIQAFVRNENVANYKRTMEKVFGDNSCHVLKVRKYGGVVVFR